MADSIDDSIYPVKCDCGYFGMSDDCLRGRCPNCRDIVKKDKSDKSIKEVK